MQINFSVRGNGACALCKKNRSCDYQDKIKTVMKPAADRTGQGMEIVIYTCPAFVEKS